MTIKRILLGTTALLGAGLVGATSPVQAVEVTPGGKLDVKVSGFARFLAGMGDVKEKFGTTSGGSVDFRNDTEVHILPTIKDESTGIEGGARIEFEADTNRTDNTDETYVFLKGAFGEFRLGDEDGPQDNMKVGAPNIAVGTGGIDGTVVGGASNAIVGTNSSDATKIVYYTPTLAGFQLGVSYAPHAGGAQGDVFPNSTDNNNFDDFVEGGLVWTGSFGDFGLVAGVTGGVAHSNKTNDDLQTWNAGISTTIFGFKVAAAYGDETNDLTFDRTWANVGVAAVFGPVGLSVTYGKTLDSSGGNPEGDELVAGAEVGLIPGVALSGEVSWFDRDAGASSDGIIGVVRVAVSF